MSRHDDRRHILAGNYELLDKLYAEHDHWFNSTASAIGERDRYKFELDALKEKLAQITAHDAKLDGGDDPQAPTGDDYNEVLSILGVHK